jgi:hypothetical protein
MSSTSVTFAKDDVLVLLGAGASVDAGIPHSAEMVRRIEAALENEWKEFKNLYNYVRSAIFYADGIRGTHPNDAAYNIERLVVCLDELARREEHPLYPFVGAWNPRLLQVAGQDFQSVSTFRTAILDKLRREWIELQNFDKARYFNGLLKFQKEFNYPLHVFTLNYDLCVEKTYAAQYHHYPERGFDKDRSWSHELMEGSDPGERSLYLYKLHGSIDWTRSSDSKLTFSDSTSTIKTEDSQIIFGLTYKLQYVDPFLFLVYQLRRRSLEAKLLLVIGYGFADEHINGILAQALRRAPDKRLLVVTYAPSSNSREKQTADYVAFVGKQLELTDSDGKVCVHIAKAEKFLGEELSLAMVSSFFPEVEGIFDDVPTALPAKA